MLVRFLAELERTEELYFDSVSQIRMQNWSRGRIALVGDAAFCVSLLAGQGSALAMISAYVLAGELAAASGRYQQAFARYDSAVAKLYRRQAARRRTLCWCLRAENAGRAVVPQSGGQGICYFPVWPSSPSAGISPIRWNFPTTAGRRSIEGQSPND